MVSELPAIHLPADHESEAAMTEIAARRLAAARPAGFGAPPGAMMGDPLSVPESDAAAYPAGPLDEPEPLWLKLPAELAAYFDLGFCHTDEICPSVILRVTDDDQPANPAEVCGPPEAFLALAEVIAALCRSVPCISHGARPEAARREAG